MFTGLIADLGTVTAIDRADDGVRLSIDTSLAPQIGEGGSVAVNGVCLTAAAVMDAGFAAEVMNQTLSLSSLARLAVGDSVNLELALRAQDRLGGHIVQGHVDGIGHVDELTEDGFARRLRIECDRDLLRYVVAHGSIAVNGVSLTVADIDEQSFSVSLIPETLARTTLGEILPGMIVNLEVDVLAKYVEKAVRVTAQSDRWVT